MTFGNRTLRLLAVALFGAQTVACGEITLPLTLATEGDNFIEIYLPDTAPIPQTTVIEGGVDATVFAEFNFFDLLFKNPILGVLQIDSLLLAGTPFALVGVPTGAVCIAPDPLLGPGGGMVTIDLFGKEIVFDSQLTTVIEVEEPFIANQFPGGLPFAIDVSSTQDFTLLDLIGLLVGTGSGISVSQEINQTIEVPVFGFPIPTRLEGVFTLGTANSLPSSELLDACEVLVGS